MAWASFWRECHAAGGVVRLTTAARAAGLDPSTVRRRAARERWWRPYRDVVAAPGTRIDGRTRALAATLHLRGRNRGDDLVAATRWTAAHLLGVRRTPPSRVQVLMVEARRLTPRGGVEIVRGRHLVTADVRCVDHVPTVVPARLVRDLAPVCNRGRTDSPLELEARTAFATAGIPLDRGQVRVPLVGGGALHLDLGIAAICFAVEVDSFGFHSRREDVTRDAHRANAIAEVADDWRVLRLTWESVGTPGPRSWHVSAM